MRCMHYISGCLQVVSRVLVGKSQVINFFMIVSSDCLRGGTPESIRGLDVMWKFLD